MTTNDLNWASVNIDTTDSDRLADFWGAALGRPVIDGATPGTKIVDAPDSGAGIQMVFHLVPDAGNGAGGFRPTLLTDHHEQETARLNELGATLVSDTNHGPIRLSVLADPDGNPFNLVTWQAE
jgi:predicted enzyme related to lactoylglutathione lyase